MTISFEQLSVLQQQPNVELARWWRLLNHWEWPDELPGAEPVVSDPSLVPNSTRAEIMNWIENLVGQRWLLRLCHIQLSESEFDDWYRGHYEGDLEALSRDALRFEFKQTQPIPRRADGLYGTINANDTPGALRLRVTVDGRDVTSTCFEASDVEGYACCYEYDHETGAVKLDEERGQVRREVLHGKVVISEIALP